MGRYVVDRLVEQGVPVIRAAHDVTGSVEGYTRRFDFAAANTWGPALEGVDRVFLMRPPAISDVKGVIRPFIAELARRGGGKSSQYTIRQVIFVVPNGAGGGR